MTAEELDKLTRDCPFLYHVATKDSWPLIRKHGLLPTAKLGELFELSHEELQAVCTENLNTGVVVVKSAQDGA